MENVGNQIINLRKKHKLSQAEIGRKLDITSQAVSRIENGGSVRVTTLQKLEALIDELEGNKPKVVRTEKAESVGWYRSLIDEYREKEKQYLSIIQQLTSSPGKYNDYPYSTAETPIFDINGKKESVEESVEFRPHEKRA